MTKWPLFTFSKRTRRLSSSNGRAPWKMVRYNRVTSRGEGRRRGGEEKGRGRGRGREEEGEGERCLPPEEHKV